MQAKKVRVSAPVQPATVLSRSLSRWLLGIIFNLVCCVLLMTSHTFQQVSAAALTSTTTPVPVPNTTTTPAPTSGGKLIFELDQGVLRGAAGTSLFANTAPRLLDFRLEAVFFNPYDGDTTLWAYGVAFGVTAGTGHVFLIASDRSWSLIKASGTGAQVIQTGALEGFEVSLQTRHEVEIEMVGITFRVWLDGVLIADITLEEPPTRGNVALAAAAAPRTADQVFIRYRALKVYDLDTPFSQPPHFRTGRGNFPISGAL